MIGYHGHGSIKRKYPKIGRNERCPCGSGKKWKFCHGKVQDVEFVPRKK